MNCLRTHERIDGQAIDPSQLLNLADSRFALPLLNRK